MLIFFCPNNLDSMNRQDEKVNINDIYICIGFQKITYAHLLYFLNNKSNYFVERACTTPNNVNGNCMPVKDCTRLYNIIQGPKPLPPSEIEFLRKSQCAGVGVRANTYDSFFSDMSIPPVVFKLII